MESHLSQILVMEPARSADRPMGVTLYTFEVPLGTPMKKVGTSGTPMLEALLKV